mmetsp:Transcript_23125/g.57021  ORF Transcript_23125/g.57021 Transcript_23125/m.57021 type:complete len:94 (+) Transcript_23125:851-1132(+)
MQMIWQRCWQQLLLLLQGINPSRVSSPWGSESRSPMQLPSCKKGYSGKDSLQSAALFSFYSSLFLSTGTSTISDDYSFWAELCRNSAHSTRYP